MNADKEINSFKNRMEITKLSLPWLSLQVSLSDDEFDYKLFKTIMVQTYKKFVYPNYAKETINRALIDIFCPMYAIAEYPTYVSTVVSAVKIVLSEILTSFVSTDHIEDRPSGTINVLGPDDETYTIDTESFDLTELIEGIKKYQQENE